MTIEWVHQLSPDEFCDIQEAVGFGRPKSAQVKKALDNSIYIIGARIDGDLVGMGRIIGDMARIAYIQDLFIKPEYQRLGIGSRILCDLVEYIKSNAIPETNITVGLMSAKGKEDFYRKHGFCSRPNDNQGCGMVMGLNA